MEGNPQVLLGELFRDIFGEIFQENIYTPDSRLLVNRRPGGRQRRR